MGFQWYSVDREIVLGSAWTSIQSCQVLSEVPLQDEKLKLVWGKLAASATDPHFILEPHPLAGFEWGRQQPLIFFFFPSITSRGIFQSSTKRNRFCAHITLYNLEKFARLTWLRKSPGPLFTSISNRQSLCFVQRMSTMTSKENSPAVDRPVKLEGRAFYESIGSPKFIVAPMVDQSEFVCYS